MRAHDLASTALGLALLVASPSTADGNSKEFVYNFMKEVGCSQLPMATCDLLDVDNARNIAITYRGLLSSRFCGTINVGQARQLSQAGATSPECDAIIETLYNDTQRFIKEPAPAPKAGSGPGGVSLHVDPAGTAADLSDLAPTGALDATLTPSGQIPPVPSEPI